MFTHGISFYNIFKYCVLNNLIFSSFASWVSLHLGICKQRVVCDSLKTSSVREAIIFTTIQPSVSDFLMAIYQTFGSIPNTICCARFLL
jgi:hypothetical protein